MERNNRRLKISLWDELSHHFSELLAGVCQWATGEALGSLRSGRRRPFGSADDVSEADVRRTYSLDPFFCSLALKNWTLDILKKKMFYRGNDSSRIERQTCQTLIKSSRSLGSHVCVLKQYFSLVFIFTEGRGRAAKALRQVGWFGVKRSFISRLRAQPLQGSDGCSSG